MKSLLIEIDDDIEAKLNRVVPPRSRKRSQFIRNAIRKALWDIEEQATRRAYEQTPDDEPVMFDPDLWE